MAIKRKNQKAENATVIENTSSKTIQKPGDKFVTLNLSVEAGFRKNLKMYAAENDTDMVKIVKAAVQFFMDKGYTEYSGNSPK